MHVRCQDPPLAPLFMCTQDLTQMHTSHNFLLPVFIGQPSPDQRRLRSRPASWPQSRSRSTTTPSFPTLTVGINVWFGVGWGISAMRRMRCTSVRMLKIEVIAPLCRPVRSCRAPQSRLVRAGLPGRGRDPDSGPGLCDGQRRRLLRVTVAERRQGPPRPPHRQHAQGQWLHVICVVVCVRVCVCVCVLCRFVVFACLVRDLHASGISMET